jgi:hypothetical protein
MKKIWNKLPHEVKHFIFAWSFILGGSYGCNNNYGINI